MWRGAGAQRKTSTKKEEELSQQVIAVAIDADKNSQHALKWTADHLLSKGQLFFLLHVRRRITSIPTISGQPLSINDAASEVKSAFLEQTNNQMKELLLPFQCFCSRRGLQCKEIILEDMDVPKTIVDFVMHQNVDKLVIGASSRGAFARTFKQPDVPTSVSKIAPDFCSVYVISKGKMASIRPATRSNTNAARKAEIEVQSTPNQFRTSKSEPEVRNPNAAPERSLNHPARSNNVAPEMKNGEIIGERNNGIPQSVEHLNYSYYSVASCPSPSRTSFERPSFERPSISNSRELPDSLPRQSRLAAIFSDQSGNRGEQGTSSWSNSSSNAPNERFSMENKEETQVSWSSSSTSTTDEVDYQLQRLKLELKLKTELLEKVYSEQDPNRTVDPNITRTSKPGIPIPRGNENKSNQSVDLTQVSKGTIVDGFAGLRYRRYTHEEIRKATENFSEKLKIGEGGYGPVYKCTIDHTLVAVKVLGSDASQGMKQFQNEVEVLSCIRHPNMVLLMGACPDSGCLVYEYMSNGSLEDRLSCSSGSSPLSWQLRFKIAAEIASGLLFLHQTKPEPLVHRDLKPANILLDNNFVAKIADVGLARLIPQSTLETKTQMHMTAAAGTFCYIDPEYQKTGMVSTKSDVYALGIILLQIITGREPIGLAYHVDEAVDSGNLAGMLDPKVTDWPMEETTVLAQLGLKCSELNRRDRPDLASIVLPELNRLRAFANASLRTSLGNYQQRAMSSKAMYGASDMYNSQFLDQQATKGVSFML